MKTIIKTTAIVVIAFSVFNACKKDKNQVPIPKPVLNEPEVITTVKLTFTDSANTSNISTAVFKDADGPGGNPPSQFDSIKINPNKTYLVSILLLDESKSPADTISKEVKEEAKDHLFCFTPSGVSAAVTITDKDVNNLPIGLESKWKTTNAGTGTMKVQLKHQTGSKTGSCDPGETDIEVLFPIKIQ